MISSSSNGQMKEVVKLLTKTKYRREQGRFIVEGIKMFEEIPKDWLVSSYISESYYLERKEEPGNHQIVKDSVFREISDTQTPQGILAVVKQPVYPLEELLSQNSSTFLILEDVKDPGNLGTMIRTGEGAGISGVIMSKNTVDLFNPKVIRSTMGSIYRVPFLYTEDLFSVCKELKKNGVSLYGAHLNGTHFYDQEVYQENTGILIGNESKGLSEELAGIADCLVRIPMEGKVESLNAAVAASLLMYERMRQRRNQ